MRSSYIKGTDVIDFKGDKLFEPSLPYSSRVVAHRNSYMRGLCPWPNTVTRAYEPMNIDNDYLYCSYRLQLCTRREPMPHPNRFQNTNVLRSTKTRLSSFGS